MRKNVRASCLLLGFIGRIILKLGNVIKKRFVIITLVVISLFIVFNYVEKALDKALNQPGGKPHTEMMLWDSPGYKKEPQLNFYKFDIYPEPDKIRVVYKIENISEKVIEVQNAIDLEVVAGDPKTHSDPEVTVWTWSQNRGDRKIEKTSLAPGGLFKEEISIERQEAKVNLQYYINALYKGEIVAQYKIMEGMYN
jgi:hypothetical protein